MEKKRVNDRFHHHHHLSRSCHCWQMASTTRAMHFDPGPFSSIDCQRLPRCHLSISFWVFLLVVFHLWVSTLMLFSPTWCSSFWLHVLPTVLSCTSLFLSYLSPLFSILLSRFLLIQLHSIFLSFVVQFFQHFFQLIFTFSKQYDVISKS